MKIEKEVVERTYYVCEGCNLKHYYSCFAEKCERDHKCKHDKFKYYFSCLPEYQATIEKSCSMCDKQLEEIDLSDYRYDNHQSLLAYIFDYLEKNTD